MTVVQLITRITELPDSTRLYIEDVFGNLLTTDFECDSWRGAYDTPTSGITLIKDVSEATTKEIALANLQDVDGTEVQGYRGGTYYLSEDKPLYIVADFSRPTRAIITSIDDNGKCIVDIDRAPSLTLEVRGFNTQDEINMFVDWYGNEGEQMLWECLEDTQDGSGLKITGLNIDSRKTHPLSTVNSNTLMYVSPSYGDENDGV